VVADKHVPAFRFQSVSPGAGALVWFSCSHGVKVNGAYYCDVLLLKQLLPYICQAAGDCYFPVHHACTRASSCCDTRLRISHQTCALPIDQTSVVVIQECIRNNKVHHTSPISCGY